MGYFRCPDYYKNFVCLGDRCRDTCCQHWEIDIDDNTYEYWQNVGGALGEKLMAGIEENEDGRHIKLDCNDMCPFLTENKLCSLYTAIGEENISRICREHPRWYNWYSDGREAGMGICCEEVARQVLSDENGMEFIQDETDEEADEEYSQTDIDAENFLFEKRDEIFSMIKSGEYGSIDALVNAVCNKTLNIQDEYDDRFLFGANSDVMDYRYDFAGNFFTEENVNALTDRFLSFEINDIRWKHILESLKENTAEILACRGEFLAEFGDGKKEYERLMHYFIYRYFTQSFSDDDIFSKVNFALISVCFIQLIYVLRYIKAGIPCMDLRCDICKFYSSEIEYNTYNQAMTSGYMVI